MSRSRISSSISKDNTVSVSLGDLSRSGTHRSQMPPPPVNASMGMPPPIRTPSPYHPSAVLADYQAELQTLERQNAQRLERARKEMEDVAGVGYAVPNEPKAEGEALNELKTRPVLKVKREILDIFGKIHVKEASLSDVKTELPEGMPSVLIHKRYRYDHVLISSEVRINSAELVEAIASVAKGYAIDAGQIPLNIAAPYCVIYHYMDRLSELASKTDNTRLREEISQLLTFVEEEYQTILKGRDEMVDRGCVNYDFLWTIYKPGDTVFMIENGETRCAVFRDFIDTRPTGPNLRRDIPTPGHNILLFCWTLSFDGEKFIRVDRAIELPYFSNLQDIRSLPAYPSKLDKEEERIKALLKARGRLYWSLRYKSYKYYDGVTAGSSKPLKTRVMVDVSSYRKLHSENFQITIGNVTTPSRVDRNLGYCDYDNIPIDRDLTDEQCMMLPPAIYAFSMVDKAWELLFVEDIKEIQWNPHAYSQLVLPEAQKDMVQALVSSHSSKGRNSDFIEGKGNGLVILLHGPPGTGKTLTAESVAEDTRKPLYMVSSGDIGTKPHEVEKKLNQIFFLVGQWDAILLIDECDVFLEERKTSDLVRNGLIAVFLRMLEYYNGILFLTSNRIQSFDDAFQSRIHVALRYNQFTASSRRAIWKNFILRLDAEKVDFENYEKDLDELSLEPVNGRQIRNIVRTAFALAEYKGEKLTKAALIEAIESVRQFDTFLKDMNPLKSGEWEELSGCRR